MAQQLKAEVREEMLIAAEAVFAEYGYGGSSMAEIARRAQISTGNLYRYFQNKDALFHSVITEDFAESFLQHVRQRVHSLSTSRDLTELGAGARRDEEDLLGFWIENRLKVVTLLGGASGTRYEGFAARFAGELTRLTLAKLRDDARGRRLRPVVRFTVQQLFENTVRTIGEILKHHTTNAAIREAFHAFWSYQLAGLAGLTRWVGSHG